MDAHYYNGDYDVDHPSVEDHCGQCGVVLLPSERDLCDSCRDDYYREQAADAAYEESRVKGDAA